MSEFARLEARIDFLSTQVERLVGMFQSHPAPLTEFRRVAMVTAQTYQQEMHAIKVMGAIESFRRGTVVDLSAGLLPCPAETVALMNACVDRGEIDDDDEVKLIQTVISGGPTVAQQLREAWDRRP
ncbi:hypothetical protein WG936_00300 [Corynebacterium sp. H127]|uniref:hypothetical protein n=1 Tax=Corynebacterium sp. H127 TaxID=3133418 RepID=UPI00309CD484